MAEGGASGGGYEYESPREERGNESRLLADTMNYVVATLENVSTRLVELENAQIKLDNTSADSPQDESLRKASNQTVVPTPVTSTPIKATAEVKIKPSDIKVLELEVLQRLDSAARLQMFFELVEQCSSNPQTRLEIAKSRVDGDLAVMIHTAQRQREITSWKELKEYLTQEFGVEMNFDQAWRQSDSFHYDWLESPQSFVHKFKCHYAAIRGTFHDETLPDRDKLLKRKLLQGFPKNSRDMLEAFMDDNIPLNKFLGHVENERVMLMNTRKSVNSVPSPSVNNVASALSEKDSLSSCGSLNSVALQSDRTNSTGVEETLAKLTARLDQLQQQMKPNPRVGTPPRKFCAYCQTETHTLRECWRKPGRGHCFDCRRYGCRRGKPDCPGKTARTPSTPPRGREENTRTPDTVNSVNNTGISFDSFNTSASDMFLEGSRADRSPAINLVVNGKLCSALLDTGSSATLIKQSAVKRLGLEIDKSRCLPSLTAVNGGPLKILGMVKVEIHIGDQEVYKRMISVVPDSYINRDLLLGCDVINRSNLTWNPREKMMIWGGTAYQVFHIRTSQASVQRVVLPCPIECSEKEKPVAIREMVRLKPHQSTVVKTQVDEQPGTVLLVYPQLKHSSQTCPLLVEVSENKTIPVLVDNPAKVHKFLKTGTVVAKYDTYLGVVENSATPVRHTQIENELEPQGDSVPEGGTRKERLQSLVEQQPWSHLAEEHRRQLSEIVLSHEQLFILDKKEIGTISGEPAHITVADPTPCKSPIYRYPEHAKVMISQMLEDMEQRGVIEPSSAAWLSPIVLVNKPDGSKRMCLDFRRVNEHLAADIYPLPRLEDLVNLASGHRFYATLDLKDAYFQVALDEDSKDLTTFSDGVSLYRFRRLPFGLSCAPAIFSRKMAEILAPLVKEGWVRNYLDDIVLWADDYDQLLERLRKLFKQLEFRGVKLNLTKCDFAKEEVKFLGHNVSQKGSTPDPKNLEAIRQQKPPTNVKEVRRFVGMCGFYRKFVANFSKIAIPLTNLLKSNIKFQWTDECQTAFETLRENLMSSPVLVSYQPELPLVLVTDASDECVGGVLHQIQPDKSARPLGYYSKKISQCEQRYSVTDKEALAVILSCRHFHHYLWGTSFEIQTDHQPLTNIFRRKTKSPRVTRWMLEMREYNFRVKYVKGKENVVADHLSRPVCNITHQPRTTWLGLTREEYRREQSNDPTWGELITYLEGGAVPKHKIAKSTLDQFELLEGILYYVREATDASLNYTLVVPRHLVRKALEVAHDQSGHFGQYKTIKQAEILFYWPSIKSDVIQYLKECVNCQRFKHVKGMSQPYKELPIVSEPLERIAIDLTDMTNGQDGHRYILTVIDHYSRLVKFFPLKTKQAQGIVARLSQYVVDFGRPLSILCDNAREFTGHEMREWADQHGVQILYTTPYHPQANGLIERMHRTLKTVLAQLCKGYPLRWPTFLGECQAQMNMAVHSSTGVSPYVAFFARQPPRGITAPLVTVQSERSEVQRLKRMIKDASVTSQRRYRAVANRKRKAEKVPIGSLVWVKSETTLPGTCSKLNAKWKGPYKVSEVIRDGQMYLVEDPYSGKTIQRAAEKVKPYISRSEIIPELEEEVEEEMVDDLVEDREIPPRHRQPPRRLIEEC